MAQKHSGKKMVKNVEIISIITVAIFLIIYLVTIVSVSPAFYTEMAARGAADNFDADFKQVSASVEEHYDRLGDVVAQVSYAESPETVADVLKTYHGDETVGTLRYVYRDVAYGYNGHEVVQMDDLDEAVMELAKATEVSCSDIYHDEYLRLDCIAFFVPVRGSLYIDGLISVVPVVDIISVGESLRENTSAIAIVESDSYVRSSLTADSMEQKVGPLFFDFIRELTQSKEGVDTVRQMLNGNDVQIVEVSSATGNYTIAAAPLDVLDGHLYLITVSLSSALMPAEYDYIGHVAVALVIAIISLAAGATFAIMF